MVGLLVLMLGTSVHGISLAEVVFSSLTLYGVVWRVYQIWFLHAICHLLAGVHYLAACSDHR